MSRARRRLAWLLAALGLLLTLALLAAWLLHPERVGPWLLRQASQATGLELGTRQPIGYRLLPHPSIDLGQLHAREPGAATPLLSAGRVQVAVPWSTVRGRDLQVTRLAVEDLEVDIARLQAWLDARAPGDGPVTLPVLANGLSLERASLHHPDWRLEALSLRLPRFVPGQPVEPTVEAELWLGPRRMPLSATARLVVAPSLAVAVERLQARLLDAPGHSHPSYTLLLEDGQLDGGADGLRMVGRRIGIDIGQTDPDFDLGLVLDGPALQLSAGRLSLEPTPATVAGGPWIPALQGELAANLDDGLVLGFLGVMPDWPERWPALPAPLDQPAPTQLRLAYEGSLGLDAPLELSAERDGASAWARVELQPLLDWLDDADAHATTLPPGEGWLQARRIELDGATLHGVRVELEAAGGDGGD